MPRDKSDQKKFGKVKDLKPGALGTGMAAKAAKKLTTRQKKLKEAMEKAGIK